MDIPHIFRQSQLHCFPVPELALDTENADMNPTRRRVLADTAVALGGLALTRAVFAETKVSVSRVAESIHQEVSFKENRKRIYEALIDAKQFDKVMRLSAAMQSGMPLGAKPTQISRENGGGFVVFGGHIEGRQIELIPNERIVQAWRVVTWDAGLFSIARFVFIEQGAGTKIVFDHSGFPIGQADHLAEGWKSNYWEPLEKYLA
jgi:activator of HSP90 ATPase